MKKLFSLFLCVALIAGFVSCSDSEDDANVSVTGVTLDRTSLAMGIQENVILTATVLPQNASNKTVKWKSNKTNIVTVSSEGVVVGKAVGEATITVTTDDGQITAKCEVTVLPTGVTGVTLNKQTLPIVMGESSALVATVTPAVASNKEVTWSCDKTDIVTVSDKGVVYGRAIGTAVVTVTTVDGGKTAQCTITVSKPVGLAVGNYFYSDGTNSVDKDENKTCVGIVFWLDPSKTNGMIVSLDEGTGKTWAQAQEWTSSNPLPSEMTWIIPTKDELQFVWCAYNGEQSVNWSEGTGPAANKAAQEFLNSKLTSPFFPIDYWASTFSSGVAWTVNFFSGATYGYPQANLPNRVRTIAKFQVAE